MSHRANSVTATVYDSTGAPVNTPIVRVALNAPAGAQFSSGTDFFSVAPHDWTGNSSGVTAMSIVPPGDLLPAGMTYTVTLGPDTAYEKSYTTTSFAYSALAQTLADILPVVPSISRVSMAFFGCDDSGNGVQGISVTAQLLTDSLVAGTTPPVTALAAEVASDLTDSSGIATLSLIPSSSVGGALYKCRVNGGTAFTIAVPDGGGYINDPANLRSVVVAGSVVSEALVVSSSPGIVYHASPVTLKDDLEMARWRDWQISFYGPRPPLTYGPGRLVYY